jgi:hypothetical protein
MRTASASVLDQIRMGEDGSEIPVDTVGSEISALVGKFAGI